MKIAFFGTPLFAANILEYLLQNHIEICAIVTRPDRPQGRSLKVSSSHVKNRIQEKYPHLPILQPERASIAEFAETLHSFSPDLFVVVAYGEILKNNILEIPKYGSINVHASLLPKYRGAAPMQRCLMNGDKETGISIIEMVLQMDAGDILKMVKIPVPEEMTFGELEEKLCQLSGPALLEVIDDFKRGNVKRKVQNPAEVTFAPKITAEEEKIDWMQPAKVIHNLIRALSPYPGAWTMVQVGEEVKRLKIKLVKVVTAVSGNPGKSLKYQKDEWIVACGNHAVRLLEVQLEGKKTLSIKDFISGMMNIPQIII